MTCCIIVVDLLCCTWCIDFEQSELNYGPDVDRGWMSKGTASMDLFAVLRFYIDKMLKDVGGMKVLVLDAETTQVVSMVFSQSEILEQEVFLVEKIEAVPAEKLLHLKVNLLQMSCQPSTLQCCIQFWSLGERIRDGLWPRPLSSARELHAKASSIPSPWKSLVSRRRTKTPLWQREQIASTTYNTEIDSIHQPRSPWPPSMPIKSPILDYYKALLIPRWLYIDCYFGLWRWIWSSSVLCRQCIFFGLLERTLLAWGGSLDHRASWNTIFVSLSSQKYLLYRKHLL